MVCIYCSSETRVTNSRLQKKANQVWRRRQCLNCHAVFSTEERANTGSSLLVIGSNGNMTHREPFQRELLLLSLYDSLRHRKTALSDATALTDTVWSRLLPQIQDASLQRDDIVKTSTEVLKRFDKAAATSYQAFHPITRG